MVRTWCSGVLMLVGLALASPLAAQEYVRINAPENGAKLDATGENNLVYEVQPAPRGDHVHVYVDDKQEAILRENTGSYTLTSLTQGRHDICIKVVNKSHTPIGVQNCVRISVQ